jgi:hypothetical protein
VNRIAAYRSANFAAKLLEKCHKSITLTAQCIPGCQRSVEKALEIGAVVTLLTVAARLAAVRNWRVFRTIGGRRPMRASLKKEEEARPS